MRRALYAGIHALLAAAVADAYLRWAGADPIPGLYGAFGLGFLVGLALPLRPGAFLLWAGRRLGVGEALLGAWELARRGETALLARLVDAAGLRDLRPTRILIPRAPEAVAMATALAIVLALHLAPPFPGTSPVPPPPVGIERSGGTAADGAAAPEGARTPAPGPPGVAADAGPRAPERPGAVPPGGVPTTEAPPPPAPGAPGSAPGGTSGGSGDGPHPGGAVPPEGGKEGISPRAPSPMPLAGEAVPAEASPGPGGRVAGADGGTSDGEGGAKGEERTVFAPRAVPGPQAGGGVPAPRPGEEGGEDLPPEGTAELAGETPGEAPTPGEGRDLWHIAPPRATEASTRPGEGPARSSVVISPPPEPPGAGTPPYVPPVGGVEPSLGGRDLPPGAAELVRRYFLLLAEEGG